LIDTVSYEVHEPMQEVFALSRAGWFGLGQLTEDDEIDCWYCSGLLDTSGKLYNQVHYND